VSIPPFVCNVGSQPRLYSPQIGEGSLLQPEKFRLEVTGKRLNPNLVIRAQVFPASSPSAQASPPRDPVGQGEAVLCHCDRWDNSEEDNSYSSVEQAVEWNEKLNPL